MMIASKVTKNVFPTRVGVNRDLAKAAAQLACFPHPRGGEPLVLEREEEERSFSPPAWG